MLRGSAYMAGQRVDRPADQGGSALDIGVALRAGTGPHADLKRSKKFGPVESRLPETITP
jgi:hypothetical protein